jgi:hypothetical protein
LKKFKTKDQIVKGARLQRLKMTKSGAKLKKIKSLMVNWVQMLKSKTKDQDENDTKLWG